MTAAQGAVPPTLVAPLSSMRLSLALALCTSTYLEGREEEGEGGEGREDEEGKEGERRGGEGRGGERRRGERRRGEGWLAQSSQ